MRSSARNSVCKRMLAPQMTDKELRKAINEEKYNLGRRIKNIEKYANQGLPQYAAQRYRELEQEIPKSLRKVDGSELRSIYRKLRYISNLKSSTVKGAREVQKNFEPLNDELKQLSEKTQSNIWKVLESFLESAPSAEKFKYEVLGEIIDMAYVGMDKEESKESLINAFMNATEAIGKNGTDEDLKLLFSKELGKIL